MSVPARLAGFAAALTALFGLAFAGGHLFGDGRPRTTAGDAHAARAMSGMDDEHGAAAPQGLSVAASGLRLVAPDRLPADRTASFTFRIVDADGATVRDFDVEHGKRLHLIVVGRDLTGFQHLHPRQDAAGAWTTTLRLPAAGAYRVFADFRRTGGERLTLASDLLAAGAYRPAGNAPAASSVAHVDGYDVALAPPARSGGDDLDFTVTRGGRPVALQPYLGTAGHLVALRAGDLAYLHVHPQDGAAAGDVAFGASFPSAGRYRLFLQFRHGDRVHTAVFDRTEPVA